MPFFKSKPKLVEKENQLGESEVFFRLDCKYIGSQAVDVLKKDDQQRFVNEKLTDMKESVRGVTVVLVISTSGLKTFDRSGKAVKLAHAITRVASSTCNPEGRLFAYVARTRQSNGIVNMQAHIYRTKKTSHAQQLATFTSRAFKLAFTRATFVRDNAVKSFDEEVETSAQGEGDHAPVARRRWAKQELARGHDYSEHRSRARLPSGPISYHHWSNEDAAMPPSTYALNGRPTVDRPVAAEPTPPSPPEDVVQLHTDGTAPQDVDGDYSVYGNLLWNTANEQNSVILQDGSVPAALVETEGVAFVEEDNAFETESFTVLASSKQPLTDAPDSDDGLDDALASTSSSHYRDGDGGVSSVNNDDEQQTRKSSNLISEDDLLAASEWFQSGLTREMCEEVLAGASVGSFLVRQSQSATSCYGLTVCCEDSTDGGMLKNFLISPDEDGKLQIQGCVGKFDTLIALIAHYASSRHELPVVLRLADDNPLFSKDLLPADYDVDCDTNTDSAAADEFLTDPDYDHYCNSETIMTELQRCVSI